MVEAEQVAAPGDGGRFRLNSALSSLTSSARGAGTAGPRRTADTFPSSRLKYIKSIIETHDTTQCNVYTLIICINKHILYWHTREVFLITNTAALSFVSEIH